MREALLALVWKTREPTAANAKPATRTPSARTRSRISSGKDESQRLNQEVPVLIVGRVGIKEETSG